VNKIWSIALIVVASLAAVGGTYWYFEIRETPDVVQQVQQETVPKQPTSVEAPPKKAETIVQAPKPVVAAVPSQEEQDTPSTAPVQVERPQIEEPKPVMQELPPPVSTLLTSPLFARRAQNAPDIQIPYAPSSLGVNATIAEQQSEPSIQELPQEAIAEQAEVVVEQTEQAEEPIPSEPEKMILTPKAPATPEIPTSRTEFDPTPLTWTVGASVSFIDFQWPGPEQGFDAQLQVLKQGDGMFGYGAMAEYTKVEGDQQLSLMATGTWTINKKKDVSFPLSISLGPSFFLGANNGWGIRAKLYAGISYAITRQFGFFYQAGVEALWNITDPDLCFGLEPMRVGFTYSF